MNRLEAIGHQKDSVIEIAAERSGHSIQTAIRHYISLRSKRRAQAAKRAWEAGAGSIPAD